MKPVNRRTILLPVLVLAAATLVAQTTSTTPKTSTGVAKKVVKPASKPAVTAADVEALKDALAAQQKQIEHLQQLMEQREAAFQQAQQQAQQQLLQAQSTAAEAQNKATSVESAANQERASVDKLSSDLVDVRTSLTKTAASSQDEEKRVSALEGVLGRFRFNGDMRVRGESYFQSYSNCNANGEAAGKGPICADRNRARIRIRFGFDGKLNEDFIAGIALATGSLGDPSTTNETLTNFFDRKTIGLDRGYITYNPVAHKWLSLTGGKFAYTWQRTSVTFDPDINPEGFVAKLSWDLSTPVVKNFSVQGVHLLFNENTTATFLTAHDSFASGGQVSGKVSVGRFSSTPSFTILNFRNIDAILNASAFAVQATTGTSSSSPAPSVPVPGEGPGCSSGSGLPSVPPCAFAANKLTNSTYLDASGKPHFLSQFLYADLIFNNQVKTPVARLPFNLLLEYENNLNAASHPNDFTNKVNPNLGKQSHGYLVDVSLGQVKNRNDFQFGYAWERLEQDAILASWAESDQRAPTNILQNRIYGLWRVRPNVVASYTLWIGRTLNPNLQHAVLAPGWPPTNPPSSSLALPTIETEPWLKRQQFDLIYSF
jgi:hypothetical protein